MRTCCAAPVQLNETRYAVLVMHARQNALLVFFVASIVSSHNRLLVLFCPRDVCTPAAVPMTGHRSHTQCYESGRLRLKASSNELPFALLCADVRAAAIQWLSYDGPAAARAAATQ